MTTAREIIRKALLKIGALVKTEDPSADEANDALMSLNALISSWSNDSLTLYARSWETFTLTSGIGTYTIGPGGNFNTTRPLVVRDAYVRLGGTDYAVGIVTDEAYNSISFKALTGIPQFLNYDNAYPLANIRIYPVPSSAYPLFLLTEKAITQFATLDIEMSLPDGWERALVYNLALELAPEYAQPVDPSVVNIANSSLGLLRTGVAKNRPMDAYPQDLTVRNVYTGWYN